MRKRVHFSALFALMCLILLTACSGSKPPGTGKPDPVSGLFSEKQAKNEEKAPCQECDCSAFVNGKKVKLKNVTIQNAPTTNTASGGSTVNSSPSTNAETGSRDKAKDQSKVKSKEKTITRTVTKTITKTAPPWWIWPVIFILVSLNAYQFLRRFI